MEKDRIAKRVYVRECAGSCTADRLKDCLRNKGLDVRQARRMVQDRSECWAVYEGACMGHNPGDEPRTLKRCHSCGLSKLYEVCG